MHNTRIQDIDISNRLYLIRVTRVWTQLVTGATLAAGWWPQCTADTAVPCVRGGAAGGRHTTAQTGSSCIFVKLTVLCCVANTSTEIFIFDTIAESGSHVTNRSQSGHDLDTVRGPSFARNTGTTGRQTQIRGRQTEQIWLTR